MHVVEKLHTWCSPHDGHMVILTKTSKTLCVKLQSLVTQDKLYLFSGCREGYEFDRWLTIPGWPPYVPDLSAGKELTEPAEQLANFWAGKATDGVSFTS